MSVCGWNAARVQQRSVMFNMELLLFINETQIMVNAYYLHLCSQHLWYANMLQILTSIFYKSHKHKDTLFVICYISVWVIMSKHFTFKGWEEWIVFKVQQVISLIVLSHTQLIIYGLRWTKAAERIVNMVIFNQSDFPLRHLQPRRRSSSKPKEKDRERGRGKWKWSNLPNLTLDWSQ